MKTNMLHCFILSIFLFSSSCSRAVESSHIKEEPPSENPDSLEDKKILIVYLSRTKNTKALAAIIQRKTGGDLVEIELEKPYPEHYQTMVDQVAEENRTGYLPPLKTKVQNMESYDIIFIGFPTWGMQLPPPLKSFLSEHNLTGKTIIPFNTNAGYGIGTSFETVKKLAPNSKILDGYSTQGAKERDGILFVMEGTKEKQVDKDIELWLNKIGLLK